MGKAGKGSGGGPHRLRQKMMRRCLVLLILASTVAKAQTPEVVPTGLGNLPPGFYPAPPCAKPKKPVFKADKRDARPGELVDPLLANDIDEYNGKITEFNKAVTAYNSCAKSYVEKSNYDIERIVSTVNTEAAEVRGTALPRPPTATGNLSANFYPRSSCVKPNQAALGTQPAQTDVKAMSAYNQRVAAFNQQAVAFTACLKTYQDKARRDIQEIQATVQAASTNDDQAGAPQKP